MKKSVHIFAVLTLAAFTLFSCASKEKEIPETLPEAEITAPEEVNEDSDSVEESQTTEEDTPDESDSTEDDEVQDVSEVQIIEEDFLEEIIEPEVFEEELPPEPEEPEIQDITEDLPEAVEAEPLSQEETSDMENLLITSEQETESQNEPDSAESESTDIVTDIPKDEETDKNNSENNIKNNIDEVIDFADSSADEVENLDSETTNEEEKVQEEEPVIIPSRSVSLKNGQSLDIEYPGKGWIFLGATDGSKNLTSTGRKTNPKTTNFTLIARVPGTVILHFYKEDLLEGKYIDDYLEVTVEDIKSKSSIHVKAPAYSEVVPKKPEPVKPEPVESEPAKPEPVESEPVSQKPEIQESKKSEPLKTEPKKLATIKPEPSPAPVSKTITEEPKTDILSAEEYLSRAKKAQDEKNYTEMYNNLQNFLLIADQNKDEGLFLLAGLYEGNSEYRNIKKSVELYEEITETYPLSPFFDEAQKREIYLRRFYMNGR